MDALDFPEITVNAYETAQRIKYPETAIFDP
jgi:hypothetical protein